MNFIKDLSLDKIQNLAEDAYNQAKPKTDVEARVYEVLSHKNWGASGSLMNEIARDTYDAERFAVVSSLMWDGMENQRPAAWKVVFKSLNLLDHLVKNGAERCVDDARNHGHILRALGQFNYYEGTIDRGLGVREKSKQILEVLGDDERVREERQKARKLREKFGNFNKGSSGIGGGGTPSGPGGYGNQESWNNKSSSGGGSSGYGEGGIYDNDKKAVGRYGNSSSTAAPTFASVPGEKKKSKKKKKKPPAEAKPEPAPAPAAPVMDLLDFGAAPAPAAAAEDSADFGAFSSAPAPAAGGDDFADFDQIGSKNTKGPDPFASAPVAAAPQPAAFNAFGNNAAPVANNNNMMMNNNMMGNPNMMNNNMAAMGQAFNNMSVNTAPVMQQPPPAPANDDDFGDFNSASVSSPVVAAVTKKISSDPMAGLINLDGLSKNPSKKMTMNQSVNPNSAAAQYQQAMQNQQNGGQPQAPGVVSAGGSDAISSMMAPGLPQQQMAAPNNFAMNNQTGGMPMNPQMQQQQQFGMQGNMMGGNPQMMGGMGMQGGMNQMGGMNPQMGGMNQMGGMQGGMNQMGNMGMGGQQQMNPNMMGGMGMQGGMNPQMGMNNMGMNNMGGMQGGMNNMGGMGMQGGFGGQQQSFR